MAPIRATRRAIQGLGTIALALGLGCSVSGTMARDAGDGGNRPSDAADPADAPAAGGGSDGSGGAGGRGGFVHPGLLHAAADFQRMQAKVAAGAQPWTSGWDVLVANAHASLDWTPKPAAIV